MSGTQAEQELLHIQSIWISEGKLTLKKHYSIIDPEPWSLCSWSQIILNTHLCVCMRFPWLWGQCCTVSEKFEVYYIILQTCGLCGNNLFSLRAAYSSENLSTCLTTNAKQITCCLWNRNTDVKLGIKNLLGEVHLSSLFARKICKVSLQQVTQLWLEDKENSHLSIKNRVLLLYHSRESSVSP